MNKLKSLPPSEKLEHEDAEGPVVGCYIVTFV